MLYEDYESYLHKYKAEYGPQTIVLMQCGSFYEMYDDGTKQTDLKTLGELLNIQVSRRNKSIIEVSKANLEMAGFPAYTLNKFLNTLVQHNYTIIVVSQVTPPPNPKRMVTDIVSPGTFVDAASGGNACGSIGRDETTYLLSIFIEEFPGGKEKAAQYSIGASLVDLSTGKTFVFETTSRAHDIVYPLDELYRITATFNPREVTICGKCSSSQFSFENVVKYLDLQGKCVHDDYMKHDAQFQKLAYQEELLRRVYPNTGLLSGIEFIGLERMPCALVSYVRLLQFVNNHNENVLAKVQVPTILEEANTLILSYNSARQLDILGNQSSLCSLLNNCKTAVGRRFFKERLTCPLTSVKHINESYNAIERIIHTGLIAPLAMHLSNIYDAERLFRKVDLGTIHPCELGNLHSSLVSLRHILVISDPNQDTIDSIDCILSYMKNDLAIDELQKYNMDNISASIFVRGKYTDIDELYDELSTTYDALTNVVDELNALAKDTIFKLENNERDGYYIAITNKRFQDFKKLHKTRLVQDLTSKPVSSSSSSLKVSHTSFGPLNDKLECIILKLKRLVTDKYKRFLSDLSNMTCSRATGICRTLAFIDFYWCCAFNAERYCYSRPQIDNLYTNKSYIQATSLRHPIIEQVSKDTRYVSNDVSLGAPEAIDGMLLYGLNSSGKSSLMKSIGIAIVMAQAGMFVPCDTMVYYPYNYIFTRILSSDDIFKGQSTFTKEIAELRGILCRANSNSLVLGDELCSGTESNSAISIVATGVHTLASRKASFVFATHLHTLVDIQEVKAATNVKAFHLAVEYDLKTKRLIYDRRLKEGNGSTLYGLEVCKSLDMDRDFLEMANTIRQRITDSPSLDTTSKSRYNKDIFVDRCGVCGSKATEVHHILQQKDANAKGFIGHVHKNDKHNLVSLCNQCHDDVHHGNLNIYGYVQTGDGVQLDFERSQEKEQAQDQEVNVSGFITNFLRDNPHAKRKDIHESVRAQFTTMNALTAYKIDKLVKQIKNN